MITVEKGTSTPNFLDSAVGLVCKTRQIPRSMGQEDGKYKTVFSGTVYPADDETATGIVFHEANVTDGDAIGSVMVAGRVLKDRLTISEAAVAALQARGISFVDENGDVILPAGTVVGGGTLESGDVSVDIVD